MHFDAIILTGPTASGKSSAALEIAAEIGGEIVNADSMQVYDWLPILTAQPSVTEQQLIPHHLYGVLKTEAGSLGWWYNCVCPIIDGILKNDKIPIVVGGTGLYLKTLEEGISTIPIIPEEIRQQARTRAKDINFYDQVLAIDPLAAKTLHPSDSQRLIRAYEVMVATGTSIRIWQQQNQKLRSYNFLKLGLIPDRPHLYSRIDNRFSEMIKLGAMEEVCDFLKAPIPKESPIQRAVGLPELKAYLSGAISLEAAIAKAQQTSRNYAKRQITWLRHQAKGYDLFDTWSKSKLTQIVNVFKNK